MARPIRMIRNGRPVDPVFNLDESLFMRFPHLSLLGDRINPIGIVGGWHVAVPGQSVNRAKYSEPQDVLEDVPPDKRSKWGIATFLVSDISLELAFQLDGPVFEFRAEHLPQCNNYSHSELNTFEPQTLNRLSPPRIIRKKFRTILSERTRILLRPLAI